MAEIEIGVLNRDDFLEASKYFCRIIRDPEINVNEDEFIRKLEMVKYTMNLFRDPSFMEDLKQTLEERGLFLPGDEFISLVSHRIESIDRNTIQDERIPAGYRYVLEKAGEFCGQVYNYLSEKTLITYSRRQESWS